MSLEEAKKAAGSILMFSNIRSEYKGSVTFRVTLDGVKRYALKPPELLNPDDAEYVKGKPFIVELLGVDEIKVTLLTREEKSGELGVFAVSGETLMKSMYEGHVEARNKFIGYKVIDPVPDEEMIARSVRKAKGTPRIYLGEIKPLASVGEDEKSVGDELRMNLVRLFSRMKEVELHSKPGLPRWEISGIYRKVPSAKSGSNLLEFQVEVADASRGATRNVIRPVTIDINDRDQMVRGIHEIVRSIVEDDPFQVKIETATDDMLIETLASSFAKQPEARSGAGAAGIKNLLAEYRRGIGLYNEGRYNEAQETLRYVLDHDREYLAARDLYIRVFLGLRKYHDALTQARTLLDDSRASRNRAFEGLAYLRLAEIYLKVGHYLRAKEYSVRALDAMKEVFGTEHDETAEAHYRLGLSDVCLVDRFDMREHEKNAAANLHRGLGIKAKKFGLLSEETAPLINAVGRLYSILGHDNVALSYLLKEEKAREKIESGGRREPRLEKGKCYLDIGTHYLRMGNNEKALEYLERADGLFKKMDLGKDIEYAPVRGATALRIGIAWARQKDMERAHSRWEEAGAIYDNFIRMVNSEIRSRGLTGMNRHMATNSFRKNMPGYYSAGIRDLVGFIIPLKRAGKGLHEGLDMAVRYALEQNWRRIHPNASDKEGEISAEENDGVGRFNVCRVESEFDAKVGTIVNGRCVTDEQGPGSDAYEILVNEKVTWAAGTDKKAAERIHIAGIDYEQAPVYVCRIMGADGRHRIGSLKEGESECEYFQDGKRRTSGAYDLLVDAP